MFDLLGDGGKSCAQVAHDGALYAPFLCRYMRAGAVLGLLREGAGGVFENTAMGHLLRADVEGSMAPWCSP